MSRIKVVTAIDVGASWIRGALIAEDERILVIERLPSRDSLDGKADPDFGRTKELLRKLKSYCEKESLEIVAGCIGIPEYVDPDGNLLSKDQIAWNTQPSRFLPEIVPCPWVVESDVRCAAIAETKFLSDFVYVTVSSGISHVLVADGKAHLGHRGMAIGLGTMPSQISGKSVEQIASGLGIARNYLELTGSEKSTQEICDLFSVDVNARKVISDATEEFALALTRLVMIYDPARIVIGGGVWLGSALYRDLTREKLTKNIGSFEAPQILEAQVEHGALIGAAIQGRRRLLVSN